ncbi:MAG: sulfotransferase [Pseudomonadota bacterium]
MQIGHDQKEALHEGLKLLAKRQYRDVHAQSLEMIKRNVDDAVPYFLLGTIAIDHGNFGKADELFGKAALLSPETVLFRAHHARALTMLNRQTDAFALAEAAAREPIDDAHTADTLGVVLSRTGFHELAVPLFERASALDPSPANFHYNLGSSRQFSGDFGGAERAYQATIAREPAHYRAWSSLVSLSKQTERANSIDRLEALFKQSQDDADARLHLGHALAKSHEDLGHYAESLSWLGRAKSMKKASLDYSIEDDLALFDAVKNVDLSNHPQSESNTGPSPIFVIGLPRTGTTLIDRILSSHPGVTSAGELNTFAGLIKSGVGSPSNLVLDVPTLQQSETLDLNRVGAEYLAATERLARGAARTTDKMPLNFFYAGLISRALPNARIIAVRRGAMDSCLSNYRQLFSTNFSYYNYTFDLSDTAQYYRTFDDLMAYWRQTLPEDRFMEVRYEDVIFHQERETQRLLSFCGLTWDEACMRFHENSAPVSTASSVQVRQPLYSGSVGRWKRYGDALLTLKNSLGALAQQDLD